MRCALIGCGLSLSLCGLAGAADAPPDSAAAPATLPGIYFAPAGVSINETFKSDPPTSGSSRQIIMFNGMADANSMKLKILATTDEHWQILKVENPVLIDAQTASGEALLSPSMDESHFSYFVDSGFVHQGPLPPSYVNLNLAIPQHPTTSLRTLVATVDLIVTKDDAIKSAKIKITNDESDPPMADGCDVTFTKIDDKVKVKYTMGASAFIKSMTFLDAAGETCTGHTVSQGMDTSKINMTMQFAGKVPITVALEYFGDIHRVQATLRLKGYPLIGVGSARELEAHPADSVHEVIKPVAKAPDAPPAAPVAAPPAAPVAAPAPGITPAAPAKPAATVP
jgi:hypothetical protein